MTGRAATKAAQSGGAIEKPAPGAIDPARIDSIKAALRDPLKHAVQKSCPRKALPELPLDVFLEASSVRL